MSVDYSGFGLQDKIAVVTGASQGIGRAIALGLAKAGAHLVLAKHPEGRQDEIKEVQAEVEGLGRKAHRRAHRRLARRPGAGDDREGGGDVRPRRHPRQQRRLDRHHAGARRHRRGIRQDHGGVAEERLLRVPGGREGDDPAGRRQDHQHRIELRRRRIPGTFGLCRGEGRGASPLARAVARVGQAGRAS